jgi:hypothetical protein
MEDRMTEEARDSTQEESYYCEADYSQEGEDAAAAAAAAAAVESPEDNNRSSGSSIRNQSQPTSTSDCVSRRRSLKKSLPKKVIQTMVKLVNETGPHAEEEEEESTDEETDHDDCDCGDERSILLTQNMSKRLVNTFSEIFDDESLDKSLEIFGDSGNKSTGSYSLDLETLPKEVQSSQNHSYYSNDGFEKLMTSLKNDESFHNSLNDWMGSFSDVFDRTKTSTSGGLTKEDYEGMDRNTKRITQVGQYLRQTLKSKNLLPTQEEVDAAALSRIRRNKALQTQQQQQQSSSLTEVLLSDETSQAPRCLLAQSCRNLSEEDMDVCLETNESISLIQTTNATQPIRLVSPRKTNPKSRIQQLDENEKLSVCTTMIAERGIITRTSLDVFASSSSASSTPSNSGNAIQPVRLPSPVKSPSRQRTSCCLRPNNNNSMELPFVQNLSSM